MLRSLLYVSTIESISSTIRCAAPWWATLLASAASRAYSAWPRAWKRRPRWMCCLRKTAAWPRASTIMPPFPERFLEQKSGTRLLLKTPRHPDTGEAGPVQPCSALPCSGPLCILFGPEISRQGSTVKKLDCLLRCQKKILRHRAARSGLARFMLYHGAGDRVSQKTLHQGTFSSNLPFTI